MKVISKGEHGESITRYLQRSFPKIASIKGRDLLEVLTSILVGSKDLRYGPMPSPENLVNIRQTITKAIQMDAPIPVLIPWGGRKLYPDMKLDIAEVAGLKQILRVDECVRSVYPNGLQIRVRIEDTGARWLYKNHHGIQQYSDDMKLLIDILKGDSKIIGVFESEMMEETKYFELSAQYSELLQAVITVQMAFPHEKVEDMNAYRQLVNRGWKGTIPKEQRDYYLDRCKKVYPNLTEPEYVEKLADYFGGSKARHDLNGVGAPLTPVGSFIQINFAHPVPGAPTGLFNHTLYYRTIPGNYSRTHIAPWRSKGYLDITGDDITPRVIQPDKEPDRLESATVKFVNDTNDEEYVIVKADYVYAHSIFEYALASGFMI